MGRWGRIAWVLVLLIGGCDATSSKKGGPESQEKATKSPGEDPAAAAPTPSTPAQGDDEGPDIWNVAWSEFQYLPHMVFRSDAAALAAEALVPSKESRPQFGTAALPLSKVVGGRDFFCGLAKTGGIYCLGARPDFLWGKFQDLALGDEMLCGVTVAGDVRCYTPSADGNWHLKEKAATVVGQAKRVAAAGKNFCALTESGGLECWATEGKALSPPVDVKAKFLDVGNDFACFADEEKKLRCFGDTEKLSLPESLPIQDLAIGDDFLCVVESKGRAQCFGETLDWGAQKAEAIFAQFGTACARLSTGETRCLGAVDRVFERGASRVGVGLGSVCALGNEGHLTCKGKVDWSGESQRHRLPPATGAGTQEDLGEFLRLFKKASLPLMLGDNGANPKGVAIPRKFDKLLGTSSAEYWSGLRFELPGGYQAVTLLRARVPQVELHVFSKGGKHVEQRMLASLRTEVPLHTTHLDGLQVDWRGGDAVQSEIRADGSVLSTEHEMLQVENRTNWDAPLYLCALRSWETTATWDKAGRFVSPPRRATQVRDEIGKAKCGHDSPFPPAEIGDAAAKKIVWAWQEAREALFKKERKTIKFKQEEGALGGGDTYRAAFTESVSSAAACEEWDVLLTGWTRTGGAPTIERHLGPGCCKDKACPHENTPIALQLGVMKAVAAKVMAPLAKRIHPKEGCDVHIVDDGHSETPFERKAHLMPGDVGFFDEVLSMSYSPISGYFGCDEAFKNGLARCNWGDGGAHWEANWSMIEGKPYLVGYSFSGH